jgi:1-acyl-sn-glycerol-3-phosphate acyltransferase
MPSAPRRVVLENIKKAEAEGRYNDHVDPFDPNDAYPVTEDYPYIKTKLSDKLVTWFRDNFEVKPYTKKDSEKYKKVRIFGRENLVGIDSAIVTSNHVYMFDCLTNKYALKGHYTYITAAYFNNLKGKLGDLMRAGGMLPIKMDLNIYRKFDEAVGYYLKKGNYVLFYPEEGMWWYYKKPRPFKNGAFHFAVKYNVPVIPVFFTFRDSGLLDEEGLPILYTDVHILKPVYPKKDVSEKENVDYLRKADFDQCVETYEDVYKVPYKLDNYKGEF